MFFDVRCALAAAKMLYVVEIRNLQLRNRPSGHCEIMCVLSDGRDVASPASRLVGFFHASIYFYEHRYHLLLFYKCNRHPHLWVSRPPVDYLSSKQVSEQRPQLLKLGLIGLRLLLLQGLLVQQGLQGLHGLQGLQ